MREVATSQGADDFDAAIAMRHKNRARVGTEVQIDSKRSKVRPDLNSAIISEMSTSVGIMAR
jgi:hypothetical protein